MNDKILEAFVKATLPLREHVREMYLFGSRCRDDWRPDSDYDVLIILDRRDREVIGKFYDVVMDILLDTGRLFSLKFFSTSDMERLRSLDTPFIRNVMIEGIRIGT